MGAKAYWNAQRGKWYVRVYDGSRDWKQPVGADRAEAEAVAAEIERDLARQREERLAGKVGFETGKPVGGERAVRWWAANYKFKKSTTDVPRFIGPIEVREPGWLGF